MPWPWIYFSSLLNINFKYCIHGNQRMLSWESKRVYKGSTAVGAHCNPVGLLVSYQIHLLLVFTNPALFALFPLLSTSFHGQASKLSCELSKHTWRCNGVLVASLITWLLWSCESSGVSVNKRDGWRGLWGDSKLTQTGKALKALGLFIIHQLRGFSDRI